MMERTLTLYYEDLSESGREKYRANLENWLRSTGQLNDTETVDIESAVLECTFTNTNVEYK
jgi:hypothetical protein